MLSPVNNWKAEHSKNIAGAFDIPLHEATQKIWQTVSEAGNNFSPQNIIIQSTYPKISSDRKYKTLYVDFVGKE